MADSTQATFADEPSTPQASFADETPSVSSDAGTTAQASFADEDNTTTVTDALGTMAFGDDPHEMAKALVKLGKTGHEIAQAFVNSPVTRVLQDIGVASRGPLDPYSSTKDVAGAKDRLKSILPETAKTIGDTVLRASEDLVNPQQGAADAQFIGSTIRDTLGGAASDAASDPIGALVHLGTTVESNPQYLVGAGEVSGAAGTILGKARAILMETAKAGGSMSGIAAATSVISQVQDQGYADPTQTAKDVISAGTLGAALHGIREVAGVPKSFKTNTDQTYHIDGATVESNETQTAQEAIKNMSLIDSDVKAIYRAMQAAPKAPRINLDDSSQVNALENEGGMVPREPGSDDDQPAQASFADEHDAQPTPTPEPITKLSQFETAIDAAPGTPEFYQEMVNHVDKHWTDLDPKLKEAIGTQAFTVRGDTNISPEDVKHVHQVEQHIKGVGGEEGGAINPSLLLGATAGTAAAIYGYGKDKNLYRALGMGIAGAASPFIVKGIFDSMKAAHVDAARILGDESNDFFKKWDGNLKTLPLKEMRGIANMRRFIKPEDSLAVRQAELNQNPETLTPEQGAIYNSMQQGYFRRGTFLKKTAGMLRALIEDFAPRNYIVDEDKAPNDVKKFMSSGDYEHLSPKSRNLISRVLDPGVAGHLKAINELGLKPKYESAIDNYANYMTSTSRAIINNANLKAMIKSGVVSAKWSPGKEEVPNQYLNQIQKWLPSEYANEPKGKFIRYDKKWYADSNVAPAIQHMMDAPKVSAFMSAVDTANLAVKQVALFSFFHAKTLSEHQILMNLHDPKAAFLDANQIISGSHPIFKQLMYGKSGDIIEHMIKNGLTISLPEDAGSEAFYKGTEFLNDAVDNVMEQAGLPKGMAKPTFEGADEIAKRFNDITWQRVFTGSKLVTALNKFGDVKGKNAAEYASGKAKRLLNDEEIAEAISLTTNNVFGGQNWLRMSMDAKTDFMQQLKLRAFKPSSRIWWQRLLFAPDWTISNFRAVMKAAPLYNKDPALWAHHAYFVARAGAMYLLASNILNKINSGHYIWQNKDPLTVELDPEGRRTMVLDKSITEVGELFREPGKTLANKMGLLPKEIIQQVSNSKYFSPSYGAPPIVPYKVYSKARTIPPNKEAFTDAGYRIAHVAGNFSPIALKTATNGKPGAVGSALSGFFGVPIYYHGKAVEPMYKDTYGEQY